MSSQDSAQTSTGEQLSHWMKSTCQVIWMKTADVQDQFSIKKDHAFERYCFSLSQWLNFKLFGIIYIFSRENKVQTFFFRVHWLSEVL